MEIHYFVEHRSHWIEQSWVLLRRFFRDLLDEHARDLYFDPIELAQLLHENDYHRIVACRQSNYESWLLQRTLHLATSLVPLMRKGTILRVEPTQRLAGCVKRPTW